MLLPKDYEISDYLQIIVEDPTYKLKKVTFGLVIKYHSESTFNAITQLATKFLYLPIERQPSFLYTFMKYPIPTKDNFTNSFVTYIKDKGGHWREQVLFIKGCLLVYSFGMVTDIQGGGKHKYFIREYNSSTYICSSNS